MKTCARRLVPMLSLIATGAWANDFPTADRVLWVQECLEQHPGPRFEMVQKCACALDRMAEQVKFEQYVEMTTVVKALTIGGERGGDIRDNDSLRPLARRYRDLQKAVKSACFISQE